MTLFWMIAFIALVLIELCTVNLVCIWFAIGTLASFIFSLWIDNITIQTVIFIVVSSITLLLTKKVVQKLRGGKAIPTNLDRVIGEVGLVTEDITKLVPGEVKVEGKKWSAVSDKEINVGSKVEILSIDGVKLNVKQIKEEI